MKATQSQHRMEEIAMARILTRFKEDYSAMLSSTRFECGDARPKPQGDLPRLSSPFCKNILIFRRSKSP